MDEGHTFGSPAGDRISLYAPPAYKPPTRITLETDKGPVPFDLILERSLTCEKAFGITGECGSYECHRQVLGQCQCGRHPEGVRMTRVAS